MRTVEGILRKRLQLPEKRSDDTIARFFLRSASAWFTNKLAHNMLMWVDS